MKMKALTTVFLLISFFSFSQNKKSVSDLEAIHKNIADFSIALLAGDQDAVAGMYTNDGKIFPNNRKILSGKTAIKTYWTLPEGVKITHHKVTPSEIKIENDMAYDYGYYEGKTRAQDKKEASWKGKYVIIWKKINSDWKIYLDIWNSVTE